MRLQRPLSSPSVSSLVPRKVHSGEKGLKGIVEAAFLDSEVLLDSQLYARCRQHLLAIPKLLVQLSDHSSDVQGDLHLLWCSPEAELHECSESHAELPELLSGFSVRDSQVLQYIQHEELPQRSWAHKAHRKLGSRFPVRCSGMLVRDLRAE
eukprot:gnl/TRDRNA2_/TRDRNA2_173421_c4_seq1.p1 gnl/TRDRNA2_/TRDRNA2_173421_c4~~gnl/TRDRNA2_/TRDRNA2_173421_c4_seq1.p1  ORF type:complete len:152 (-),score=18.30 gnl/TRDRNA2_/TRDRNA2_173421_c4_seq1:71-526(-)